MVVREVATPFHIVKEAIYPLRVDFQGGKLHLKLTHFLSPESALVHLFKNDRYAEHHGLVLSGMRCTKTIGWLVSTLIFVPW